MTELEVASTDAAPRSPTPHRPVRRQRVERAGGRAPKAVVHPRRSWPYVVLSLLAAVGLVLLGRWGYDTALDVRGGAAFTDVTDPAKPGYEARVQPTATHLLVEVSASGSVGDLVLLVDGSNGKGGGVLFVPGLMVVDGDGGPTNLAELTAEQGVPALVDAVQRTLGVSVTDAAELDPDQTAALLRSAGPLSLTNPDRLVDRSGGTERELYPAGQIEVTPDDAATYLLHLNEGEPVVNRPFRAQQLWEAWIERLQSGAAAPAAGALSTVDGQGTLDAAALVAGLAAGNVNFQQLPVDRLEVPNQGGFAVYKPDTEGIAELLARLVPFPGSAFPGQRARVRLLNGTPDRQAALRAAQPIAAAGAQIVVLGNASSFDVGTTQIEYNANAQREAADAIAAKLGVGKVVAGVESDAVDVTVTLGSDFTG